LRIELLWLLGSNPLRALLLAQHKRLLMLYWLLIM
jgi:hypothetical protein